LLFPPLEEDIPFEDEETVDRIKLTDFGLAHIINPKTNKAYMKYRAGTMEYKAPEVKDVNYLIINNYFIGLLC
jgi:serine/threonine protein kinase